MFGINELKAALAASDARACRQHAEIMEELHDIDMKIETLYDVLDRAMAEMAPITAEAVKPKTVANHLKKKMKP